MKHHQMVQFKNQRLSFLRPQQRAAGISGLDTRREEQIYSILFILMYLHVSIYSTVYLQTSVQQTALNIALSVIHDRPK